MATNDILNAYNYLGSQAYDDYCQAFVEQALYGHQGVYPSAIAAWNQQQDKAVQGTQGMSPGDTVYFSPNQGNGGNGHTGIYMGNNEFISATDNGVQTNDLNNWQKMTGQQLLGYVPQGQNAQGLGAQLHMNMQSMMPQQEGPTRLQAAQQTISDMDNHKINWDDNLRSQMNTVVNNSSPQQQQGQQPQYDFQTEMNNFTNTWNQTHQTPMQMYG